MQKHQSLERFNDIEDKVLRTANRGAVMANLFEDYHLSLQTHKHSYKDFLEALALYTEEFTKAEYKEAKEEMHRHLLKRGYTYGC